MPAENRKPFERVHVTVGARNADFEGETHRPIQAAIEYCKAFGGGTVEILPGTYRLGNAVHLASGVRLLGQGEDTLLRKNPSFETPLVEDTDWYDWTATVKDPAGFEVGGGLLLRGTNPHRGGVDFSKHTVVGVEGNVLRLDRQPRQNFWLAGQAVAASLFPLVTGNWLQGVAIENLVLDGNWEENDHLDGNYGGCLFLQDCERVLISRVTARNNHGDGISWQICHDVVVEECRSLNNADLGLHPGSGSQRPVIRNNEIAGCDIGLFWCWGVKHGLAEGNTIRGSRKYGISAGYRDTDNVMRGNRIQDSGLAAVIFRADYGDEAAPHRCVLEGNLLEGAGTADAPGVGVQIDGGPSDLVIRGNRILNPEGGFLRTGIRIGERVAGLTLEDNRFEGVPCPLEDAR